MSGRKPHTDSGMQNDPSVREVEKRMNPDGCIDRGRTFMANEPCLKCGTRWRKWEGHRASICIMCQSNRLECKRRNLVSDEDKAANERRLAIEDHQERLRELDEFEQ